MSHLAKLMVSHQLMQIPASLKMGAHLPPRLAREFPSFVGPIIIGKLGLGPPSIPGDPETSIILETCIDRMMGIMNY